MIDSSEEKLAFELQNSRNFEKRSINYISKELSE